MQIIKLIDFLKTGRFGDISLGVTESEVLSFLGQPTERYEMRNAFLLAYGGWEIQFTKDEARKAFLIHHDELLYDCTNHDEVIQFENETFKLDLGVVVPFTQVRLKDILTWLKQSEIGFSVKQVPQQPLVKLESGVYLDFLDVEPVVPIDGVHACPGKNLELQQNTGKIANMDDFVLYTIGIFGR